jgi:hypothetical protein
MEQLEQFLIRWDTVISGISDRVVDEDTMYTLFYKQVKEIEAIDYDMKGFDRLPGEERTYDKLRGYCDRAIEIHRAEDNQRRKHGKHRENSPHVSAAAPAGGRRGYSKSPGRGRTRSNSPRRSNSSKRSKSPSGRKTSQGKRTLSSDRPC